MERGACGTLPTTINTASVSPNAREKASTTAAQMPASPRRRTTHQVVSQRVAPRENSASRSSRGTLRSTSSVTATISG